MSKIQYNVGTFKGLLGTAVLYLGKTTAGTEFITFLVLVGSEEHWQFMSRSALQSHMLLKDVVISSNVDVTKLADVAPDGLLDANGYVQLENAAGLPRLSTGQGYYTLKGAGIADYSADKGTPTTGSDSSNNTVVIASNAKTVSETVNEVTTWATKNWWILLIGGFLLLELLGVTNVLKLNGKKPAKKRRK